MANWSTPNELTGFSFNNTSYVKSFINPMLEGSTYQFS